MSVIVRSNTFQMKKKQERCLLAVLNCYSDNYLELLQRSGSVSLETQQMCSVACSIFKTSNYLNPNLMK